LRANPESTPLFRNNALYRRSFRAEAFWSDQFNPTNPVNGAIQTCPIPSGCFDPLQALIVSLLKLSGVEYLES
jgi:hypothetical protein